jgi:MFS family permease
MISMKLGVKKEVAMLSFAFLLIFLGADGVQSYVTPFFSSMGLTNIGFYSLMLIYLSFTVFGLFSGMFVSKYGAKKCMLMAAIFYSIYIVSLLTGFVYVIYLSSILLGMSAALLWNGQSSYLVRNSSPGEYGKNSGFFITFKYLGSTIGSLILGILVVLYLFKTSFLIYALFPILGMIIIYKMKDVRSSLKINRFEIVRKSVTNIMALRISTIGFSLMFIYGLVIGIIPIQIKDIFGIGYVGPLSSLFYLVPILFSYILGRYSDKIGRRFMILLSYGIALAGLALLYLFSSGISLVIGIFLLALNNAIMNPAITALVGDVTNKKNLEFVSSLFWVMKNIGVVSALLLSSILSSNIVYLISMIVAMVSILVASPLFISKISEIRSKLCREIC